MHLRATPGLEIGWIDMPHQAWQMTNKGMCTGWAPDGVLMGIGATDHNGRDLPMVVEINWASRTYRREGGRVLDFPAQFYTNSQIIWDSENE
jgi:hypothetical protein